ncbi:MFS transporter [Thiotrichales bacterium 19S3-7]|nr:MFS transporter [Thiotrichales bacterium 19S3-7]MCF6801808.1 MFS transporter [Thiotrichales bacterium 19S3-11]
MKKELLIFTPAILFGIYWAMVKVSLPIVTLLPYYFDTTPQRIQQIFSIAFFLSGSFPILWGALIDRFELRRFILVSAMIFILLNIGLSFSTNIYMFGILFVLVCSLSSVFLVVGRTLPFLVLNDKSQVQRALTYAMSGGYLCAWIAPFISGYLVVLFSWRSIFFIVPILAVILILIVLFLPKQKELVSRGGVLKNLLMMLTHCKKKSFRSNIIIIGLFAFFSQSALISTPFWLSEAYTLKSYNIGYILLPMLLPGILGPLLSRWLYKKLTYKAVFCISGMLFITAGFIAIFLSIIIYSVDLSYWLWVIPGVMVNLAMTFMFPIISLLGYREIKNNYNAASSVFSLSLYCSGGIGIYVCSFISIDTLYIWGILMLIAIVVASILFLQDYKDSLLTQK